MAPLFRSAFYSRRNDHSALCVASRLMIRVRDAVHNLFTILLILLTVSALALFATSYFQQKNRSTSQRDVESSLIPAIYVQYNRPLELNI